MDGKKTWTIVQFLEDSTVEAVPSTWIEGNDCHWPPFTKEKIYNAMRKSLPLDTSWPTHKIKIFRNATYGDYLTARQKAKTAEGTSDLNSDGETSKRKRTPKVLSSSDEEEESNLSPPPIITKHIIRCDIEPEHKTKKQNQLQTTNGAEISREDATCKNCMCKTCMERDRALKHLTQQFHVIRGMASDILEEVKAIKVALATRENIPAEGSNASIFLNVGVQFPINSDQDMKVFEEFLQINENYQKSVAEVTKVGGRSPYEFVSRTLKLIISDDLALSYSWLGRKGKKIFKNFKVASVVIEAGTMSQQRASKAEFEKSIQLWLRRAFDRKKYTENKKY